MQRKDEEEGVDPCLGMKTHDTEHGYLALEGVPGQVYLAQVQNSRAMR